MAKAERAGLVWRSSPSRKRHPSTLALIMRSPLSRHAARDRTKARIHRCACIERGDFRSGLRGVLSGLVRRDGSRIIERCDSCERFESDAAACIAYTHVHGGSCGFGADLKVVWKPE